MRVEVYYNLHKHCWSVRALSGLRKGRVIDHPVEVALTNVTFVVQPAGRERTRREGRKNVHAFARGELVYSLRNPTTSINGGFQEATYNPFKYATFVDKHTESPLTGATTAILTGKRVFYHGAK